MNPDHRRVSEAALAVVIVAHNSARALERTLPAVRAQLREGDELVVVDNASVDEGPALARRLAPEATVLKAGANTGFAAGCHAGARTTSAPLILFLNPDALPAAGCLEALRRGPPEWAAWQALVTLPGGLIVNTSGNVVHFLGIGWAGQHGQPIRDAPTEPTEVPFSSGAALVVRREQWERLGGFREDYFMYGEDLDLSLRLRLAGKAVGVLPAARVEHDYEFEKGGGKWFLLERNRWWTVLTTYPTPLLAAIAPALLLFELPLLLVAARGGWLPEKVRAQAAVVRSLPSLAAWRRRVQATRAVTTRDFASRLDSRLDSPFMGPAARIAPLVALQRLYWRAVLALMPD